MNSQGCIKCGNTHEWAGSKDRCVLTRKHPCECGAVRKSRCANAKQGAGREGHCSQTGSPCVYLIPARVPAIACCAGSTPRFGCCFLTR